MEVNYEVYPTFGVWLFSKIIFAVRKFVQSARVSFGRISVRAKWLENRLPSRARQVVFVFFLHLFTGRSQRAVYQSVRGEGFEENAFTCSVADFAVGEAGRVAREIRGKCWKKWDFSVAGWGESREGR